MSDEFYMQRCLDLAILGIGHVSPNPMVGCVIVHENQIIGEGYHQVFGESHAEVNAIHQVHQNFPQTAATLLKNSTVYVNLEPCAHFGKTPPCADLLVKHEVKSVVIGNTDPFADVNGKGIEKLKSAGIAVRTGILADECSQLNKRFFKRITEKRPYFILKWAQTADGFFAPLWPAQQWISGEEAKALTQVWRSEEDAILVGKKTALIDNPQLTNRSGSGKNPIRVVIDRELTLPSAHHLFNSEAKTIIFNEIKTEVDQHVHYVQMEDMNFYLPQKIAFQLYLMDIQSVIVEGGVQLLNYFISANLWDEARVFTSTSSWKDGIKAPNLSEKKILYTQSLATDQLTVYTPIHS